MKLTNTVFGSMIIAAGVILFLFNMNIIEIDFEILWPVFLLIPGVAFELGFFIRRKDPGLLVPGGILITYAALFFLNILFNWTLMDELWPVFPLGVAIGLFQLYFFGRRDKGVLIAASILSGFSFVSLSFTLIQLNFNIVMPLMMIVLGLIVIMRK